MNAYIGGGYGAAAGIVGAYAIYLRRRTRSLTRSLPPEPVAPARDDERSDGTPGA